MTPPKKRLGGMMAHELSAQLANDPEFQSAKAAREAEQRERVQGFRVAEQPIVVDLRRAGVDVSSVWDLVNTDRAYPGALTVLLEHLERGGYPDRVMEGIARALAVKPAVAYWDRLKACYLTSTGPEERDGVAAALAASATPAQAEDLIDLIGRTQLGVPRVFFLRPILCMGGERGRRLVDALRSDAVLGSEATALLADWA